MAIVWEVAALLESVTAKVMFPRDKIQVGNVGESKPGGVFVPAQEEVSAERGHKWTPKYLRAWEKSQMTSWNRGGFKILSSGGVIVVGFVK